MNDPKPLSNIGKDEHYGDSWVDRMLQDAPPPKKDPWYKRLWAKVVSLFK